MGRKIIFLVIILVLASGGFFCWWDNQTDVRELNKTLPEGVKVVKSLFGEEYKVVNKIDGYEFKVPKEWEGVEEVKYFPEETEQGYTCSSIGLKGKEGPGRIITIARFKLEKSDINLESWVKSYFEISDATNNFDKERIGEFEVVKTREFDLSLLGYAYFFQKNFKIYGVAGGSEEFIRQIILNGKW